MAVGIKLQQGRDVIRPLTQRRGGDGQHVDAVVQVFPKAASGHFVFEFFVRGRHHAHIDGHLARGPHGQNAALLQHAQQFDLHVHGQVADFVQKQGAPVRQLEAAQAVAHRAREGPFAVAKQFAFDQVARDGAAVDGHKRARRPRPLVVQGLRHQFFARAAFSCDQGRRRGRRQGLDQLSQKMRGLAVANDVGSGAGFHAK